MAASDRAENGKGARVVTTPRASRGTGKIPVGDPSQGHGARVDVAPTPGGCAPGGPVGKPERIRDLAGIFDGNPLWEELDAAAPAYWREVDRETNAE
jgi:hypothetical protein